MMASEGSSTPASVATAPRRSCRARRLNSRFDNDDEADDSFRKLIARIAAPDSHSILQSPQLAFHLPKPPPPPPQPTVPPPQITPVQNTKSSKKSTSNTVTPVCATKKAVRRTRRNSQDSDVSEKTVESKKKLKLPKKSSKKPKSSNTKVNCTKNAKSADSDSDEFIPILDAPPTVASSDDELPAIESADKQQQDDGHKCDLPAKYSIKTISNPDLSGTPINIVCIEDPEAEADLQQTPVIKKAKRKSFSKMFNVAKKPKADPSAGISKKKRKNSDCKLSDDDQNVSEKVRLKRSVKKDPVTSNLLKKKSNITKGNKVKVSVNPTEGKLLKIINIKLAPCSLNDLADNNPLRKLIENKSNIAPETKPMNNETNVELASFSNESSPNKSTVSDSKTIDKDILNEIITSVDAQEQMTKVDNLTDVSMESEGSNLISNLLQSTDKLSPIRPVAVMNQLTEVVRSEQPNLVLDSDKCKLKLLSSSVALEADDIEPKQEINKPTVSQESKEDSLGLNTPCSKSTVEASSKNSSPVCAELVTAVKTENGTVSISGSIETESKLELQATKSKVSASMSPKKSSTPDLPKNCSEIVKTPSNVDKLSKSIKKKSLLNKLTPKQEICSKTDDMGTSPKIIKSAKSTVPLIVKQENTSSCKEVVPSSPKSTKSDSVVSSIKSAKSSSNQKSTDESKSNEKKSHSQEEINIHIDSEKQSPKKEISEKLEKNNCSSDAVKIKCKRRNESASSTSNKRLKQEKEDCVSKSKATSIKFSLENALLQSQSKTHDGVTNKTDKGHCSSINEKKSKPAKIETSSSPKKVVPDTAIFTPPRCLKTDPIDKKPDLAMVKDTRQQLEVKDKSNVLTKVSPDNKLSKEKHSHENKPESNDKHKARKDSAEDSKSFHGKTKIKSQPSTTPTTITTTTITTTTGKETVDSKNTHTKKYPKKQPVEEEGPNVLESKPDVKPSLLITKIIEGTGIETKHSIVKDGASLKKVNNVEHTKSKDKPETSATKSTVKKEPKDVSENEVTPSISVDLKTETKTRISPSPDVKTTSSNCHKSNDHRSKSKDSHHKSPSGHKSSSKDRHHRDDSSGRSSRKSLSKKSESSSHRSRHDSHLDDSHERRKDSHKSSRKDKDKDKKDHRSNSTESPQKSKKGSSEQDLASEIVKTDPSFVPHKLNDKVPEAVINSKNVVELPIVNSGMVSSVTNETPRVSSSLIKKPNLNAVSELLKMCRANVRPQTDDSTKADVVKSNVPSPINVTVKNGTQPVVDCVVSPAQESLDNLKSESLINQKDEMDISSLNVNSKDSSSIGSGDVSKLENGIDENLDRRFMDDCSRLNSDGIKIVESSLDTRTHVYSNSVSNSRQTVHKRSRILDDSSSDSDCDQKEMGTVKDPSGSHKKTTEIFETTTEIRLKADSSAEADATYDGTGKISDFASEEQKTSNIIIQKLVSSDDNLMDPSNTSMHPSMTNSYDIPLPEKDSKCTDTIVSDMSNLSSVNSIVIDESENLSISQIKDCDTISSNNNETPKEKEAREDEERLSIEKAKDIKLRNLVVVQLRLKSFIHLTENAYLIDRKKSKQSKEVRRMVCDCVLTKEEVARGEKGCGDDCLNRLLMIECGWRCSLGDSCLNRQFQRCDYGPVEVFNAEEKGCGVQATQQIATGTFIMEYIGEVFDQREFRRRRKEYGKDGTAHFYFMALRANQFIDATKKGNISRFVNHSCDPNAETQKWTVNGELRVGFFSTKTINVGEEINFDYRMERYGREPQKCYCGTAICRGWLGEPPDEKTKEEKEEDKKRAASVAITDRVVQEKRKEKKQFHDEELQDDLSELRRVGLRNRQYTLMLSRVMVRAESEHTRTQLLLLLHAAATTNTPCLRLFMDYHGLSLLWSWMADLAAALSCAPLKLQILKTLEILPITNRTQVADSRVLEMVERWSKQPPPVAAAVSGATPPIATSTPTVGSQLDTTKKTSDTSEDSDEPVTDECSQDSLDTRPKQAGSSDENSSSDSSTKPPSTGQARETTPERQLADSADEQLRKTQLEVVQLALKLLQSWEVLKEEFRIPRKQRVQLMREHEREVEAGYRRYLDTETGKREMEKSRYSSSRRDSYYDSWRSKVDHDKRGRPAMDADAAEFAGLSKEERREKFAKKVAIEDEQRRVQEGMWSVHVERCARSGLDPYQSPIVDPSGQYYWDSANSTWVPLTPESAYAAGVIDPSQQLGTPIDPNAGYAPEPQEPLPTPHCLPMANGEVLPPLVISISLPPHWHIARDQHNRVYFYHSRSRQTQWEIPTIETKTMLQYETDSESDSESSSSSDPSEEEFSSDEGEGNDTDGAAAVTTINEEPEEPEVMEGKIIRRQRGRKRHSEALVQQRVISPIRELDREQARKERREAKERARHEARKERLDYEELLLSKDIGEDKEEEEEEYEPMPIIEEIKIPHPPREKLKTKSKERAATAIADNSDMARKIKDLFRSRMATYIVSVLNPFRKADCKRGRINTTEDFKYLARKLTHFVMVKELKQLPSIEGLECSDSVKYKTKDFVRKYMSKYGSSFKRDPLDTKEY